MIPVEDPTVTLSHNKKIGHDMNSLHFCQPLLVLLSTFLVMLQLDTRVQKKNIVLIFTPAPRQHKKWWQTHNARLKHRS